MKLYHTLIISFIFVQCKKEAKNTLTALNSNINVSVLKKNDTAYIKDNLLYVVANNKTSSYNNIIKNSGTLDCYVQSVTDGFLINYEYLGSTTKMICSYKFPYRTPLNLIYKEITKRNQLGTASNIVFFDSELRDINYETLEGIYEDTIFDFVDTGNQKSRIYLMNNLVGVIEKPITSNDYFIDSPTILDFNSITYKNIDKLNLLNDIAYYLEKKGNYKNSVSILKKVIEVAPNRVVAYMNLGDAYWGSNDIESAKKMYHTYISKMKTKGLEKKIPSFVYDRIK